MAQSKFYTHVLPNLDRIERWILAGATGKEIAKKLGVSPSAFKSYLARGKKGEPDFSDFLAAYTRACEPVDDDVESALHKLAIGYTVDLQKTFKVREIEYDEVTGKKIREYEKLVTGIDQTHVPANVQAQIFWLVNRRGDRWTRDPSPAPETNDDTGVIMIADQETLTPPADVAAAEGEPS